MDDRDQHERAEGPEGGACVGGRAWGEPMAHGATWQESSWQGGAPRPSQGHGGPGYLTAPPPPPPEPPLGQAWHSAPMLGALRRFVRQYARFSGRASRAEYWWAALGLYIASMVVEIPYLIGIMQWSFTSALQPGSPYSADAADPFAVYGAMFAMYGNLFGQSPLFVVGVVILGVWWLATLLPTIALAVRRLHDTGRSGWWYLIAFVPFAGPIILLVFVCLPPNPMGDRFAPAPWRPAGR